MTGGSGQTMLGELTALPRALSWRRKRKGEYRIMEKAQRGTHQTGRKEKNRIFQRFMFIV